MALLYSSVPVSHGRGAARQQPEAATVNGIQPSLVLLLPTVTHQNVCCEKDLLYAEKREISEQEML